MLICSNCGRENPDEASFCMACAAQLGAPVDSREMRKTVTALFCDLVGSTTLGEQHDPEVLHPILQRYFDEMRGAVERHGGRVEKFIGDAVVSVFGLPVSHAGSGVSGVLVGTAPHQASTTSGFTSMSVFDAAQSVARFA